MAEIKKEANKELNLMEENPNINISIQSIIDEIKKIKLLILLIFIIFIVATYYYSISMKNIYKGSIEIKNINTVEFFEYQKVQNFGHLYVPIDQFYLRKLFIEELEDRQEIIKFLDYNGFIDRDIYSNEPEYLEALEKKSFGLKIEYPQTPIDPHNVIFISESKKIIETFFSKIFDEVNNNVQKNLKDMAFNKIKYYEEDKKNRIEDIENDIEMRLIKHKARLDREIKYLMEQEEIARALNISESAQNDIAIKNELYMNETSNNLRFSQYYLKGYKAISEELSALTERVDDTAFIENFDELVYNKQSLMSSKEIERFEETFSKSVINSDNFKSSSYNVNDIAFEKLNISQMTVLMTSILAFIIIVLSLIISRIIISQLFRE